MYLSLRHNIHYNYGVTTIMVVALWFIERNLNMKLNEVRLQVMKFIVSHRLSDIANADAYSDTVANLKLDYLSEAPNYMDWLYSFEAYANPFKTSIEKLKDINQAIQFYASDIDSPRYDDIVDLAAQGQTIINLENKSGTYFIDDDGNQVTWEQLGFKIKDRTKGTKYHE